MPIILLFKFQREINSGKISQKNTSKMSPFKHQFSTFFD